MFKGINNGTWGFGMKSTLFPSSFNGPFGYTYNPLPIDIEIPTDYNTPKYSSQFYNGPAYNESSFLSLGNKNTYTLPPLSINSTPFYNNNNKKH